MLNVIFSQRPEAGGAAAGEEGAHGGQETGGKDVNQAGIDRLKMMMKDCRLLIKILLHDFNIGC